MAASTLISIVALSALSAAQSGGINVEPPIPFNSQIGAFRFPIKCSATALGVPISLDGFYTGTAPVYAQPNQPVYYTDVTATVVIPKSIAKLGNGIGVSYADALVFVEIDVENATPASLQVFPDGLQVNNISLANPSDSGVTVRVPPTGVLPPVGPFTMGAAGTENNIFLGDVITDLTLYNKKGKKVTSAKVTCPKLAHPVDLGTVSINGAPNTTVLKPGNGYAPNFPPIMDNQEVGYYHDVYDCNIGEYKGIPVDLIFGGELYSGYAADSTFSFPNITSFLTVPQDFVTAAGKLYDAASFETTITSVVTHLTNASPASVNVLSKPLTITSPYVSSGGLKVSVPQTGTLTAGPFTAGSTAYDFMVLSLGNANATLAIKNAAGKTTYTAPIFCTPAQRTVLYEILINPKPVL